MRTSSLRGRLTLVTMSLLVAVLVIVVTAVTLAYRASLQSDLRGHLLAAGRAVQHAGSAQSAKELVRGLDLAGITTVIQAGAQTAPAGKRVANRPPPVKAGTDVTSTGSLLEVRDTLPDGTVVTFSASSSGIAGAVTRLLAVEVVVALTALALAALLVAHGTKAALRPLSNVIETAARIAAGDKELRLRPTRTDTEVGNMAAAFDHMVDALDRAVTNAQTTETAMRRFLADASHELRTPVAALQASAESLLREQPTRPRRDEMEAALARDAAHLGRLVDDLLSLARLEGRERLADETVDVAQLTRAAVEEARLRPHAATIVVDVRDAYVRGDANGLRRVIRNLVDNALASVPERGRVEVTAARAGSEIQVRVTDSGPGIAPADRERIFDRFVRLNHAQTPGTGLGLAIARRIARQHDGDLTCDESPHGASFTLRLPAQDA